MITFSNICCRRILQRKYCVSDCSSWSSPARQPNDREPWGNGQRGERDGAHLHSHEQQAGRLHQMDEKGGRTDRSVEKQPPSLYLTRHRPVHFRTCRALRRGFVREQNAVLSNMNVCCTDYFRWHVWGPREIIILLSLLFWPCIKSTHHIPGMLAQHEMINPYIKKLKELLSCLLYCYTYISQNFCF